jgi:hypothetical protein
MIGTKEIKLVCLLFFVICFQTQSFGQERNVIEKYRLSNNYAPDVLDCYVETYTDGTSRILNKETGLYLNEVYSFFQTDHNDFCGLHDKHWCFGRADSALVKIRIAENSFDSLRYLGTGYYLAYSEQNKILKTNTWNSTYKLIAYDDFSSVKCGEFEGTIIVSKSIQGNVKYGCLSLENGEFISDVFIDSVILCPRVLEEVALVYQNGAYRFYSFHENTLYGKKYLNYRIIPMYYTAIGIYENGVEILSDKKIHSFELGKVLDIEFENNGDFVYAHIKTDTGNFKLDLWQLELVDN